MEERHPVRLHRCRFVEWSPSSITAVTFPPSSLSQKVVEETYPVLAVGHENGNVELWRWVNPTHDKKKIHQGWVVSQVSIPPKGEYGPA
jgi:U3 small nucleolar RNA-associated protein 4